MTDVRGRTVLGDFFHAPERGHVEALLGALVAVGEDGAIASVHARGDPHFQSVCDAASREGRLWRAPKGTWFLPGFVDLHIHAPQYPQLGAALDVPLETWLHVHTFPLEARYADAAFAQRVYGTLVRDLLANGTTTAVMFATIHVAASLTLAACAIETGLRAIVGKVAMDDPSCPDYYRDPSAQAAIEATQGFVEAVRALPGAEFGRVLPAVTPRFVPACTDAALEGLGRLARDCACHVQTHVSESDWEHGFVRERTGLSDARALDRFGLLGRRSVLAHGGFLDEDDLGLVRMRGAGVAHCPISNAYFQNAVFPLRAALDKGVRVGLGSDVSGGPTASIFETLRAAVASARMLEDGVDPALPRDRRGRPGSRIDWREAFFLATAGGADVLDLPVGRFAPGCRFDALLVDPNREAGTIRLFDDDLAPEAVLARILYTATKPDIAAVLVDGVRRAGADPSLA